MSAVEALRREVEQRYREMTPGSERWHERAQDVLPGGDTRNAAFFRPHPLYLEAGEGAYVVDLDGNRYLDCTTNMSSLLHGHAYPAVVEAVTAQVARGTGWAAANRPAVELAELLCERIPSVERVRFTNSGTEAVMMAVRAARAATGRPLIAKAAGSYHGSHDEFEVGGGQAHAGLHPGVADHVVEFDYNDAESVTRLFEQHGAHIAAAILDPAFMAGGFLPPLDGFLQHLRAVTERFGALLIFDEVVSLRLSLAGAQGLYGVTPDLTAMGKTIGGGFPVGAFGGSAELMERFSPLSQDFLHHSGTFNGNPVTMTAGLAAMRALDADTMAYLNRLGERFGAEAERAARACGVHLYATGDGSLRHLHFTPARPQTPVASRAADRELGELLRLRLLTDGVLCARGGLFALSTVTTEQEIDGVVARIADALGWLRPGIEQRAPQLLRGVTDGAVASG